MSLSSPQQIRCARCHFWVPELNGDLRPSRYADLGWCEAEKRPKLDGPQKQTEAGVMTSKSSRCNAAMLFDIRKLA